MTQHVFEITLNLSEDCNDITADDLYNALDCSIGGLDVGDKGTVYPDVTIEHVRSDQPLHEPIANVTVHVKGCDHSFRCECGCNVFHKSHTDSNIYICNSCNSRYIGEE